MAVLYSDESRKLLLKKSKKWNNKILIFKTLKHILEKKYFRSSNIYNDYEYFDKIRPEYILEKLYKYNKKKFSFNPKIKKGGYAPALYIRKIYKLLGAKVLFLDYKDDLLYYSKYNNTKVNSSAVKKGAVIDVGVKFVSKEKVLEKFESPDIIIINFTKSILDNIPGYYKVPADSPFYNIVSFNDKVAIKGMNYIQDSVILSNWNRTEIGGHSIAGIKCRDNKYVYNGWTRGTIDIHLQNVNFTKEDYDKEKLWVSEVINKRVVYVNVKNSLVVDKLPVGGILVSDNIHIPCELMKYDWDVKKNSEFCINKKECLLDTHSNKSIKEIINKDKNELCFSFNKGPRLLIYVNNNNSKNSKNSTGVSGNDKGVKECPEGKVLNPLTNRCINIKSINKLAKKPLSKMDKKCPEGKVLNPKTGRCIKTENFLKTNMPPGVKQEPKKCPEGKVLNPKTGRCIKAENFLKANAKTKANMPPGVKPEPKKCPEGKVLNPKTGRCIKAENFLKANAKTKAKTKAKAKTNMPPGVKPEPKKCPEGKVLNPKTGRCIKAENFLKASAKAKAKAKA
jgi:hypothetical protein